MIRYFFILILLASCAVEPEFVPKQYKAVEVASLFADSVSIRAITLMGKNLAFAGSDNTYGIYNAGDTQARASRLRIDSVNTEFRAVAATSNDFFMLGVGDPALLFKTGDSGAMELAYMEEHEKVFYDAMAFWNDMEGIAMGDPTDGCISIIVTRDGGRTWQKLPCSMLPEAAEGEAAFAASNTNISIVGDHAWIATGGVRSRILYSPDKGRTWQVFDTPVVQGEPTQGMYSVAFYDEQLGFAIGGDYTNPEENTANKIRTIDGGKTWQVVGSRMDPGYLSCVQYIPGRKGQELVAVGFQGIWFSNDGGDSFTKISDEPFYTLRFNSDSTAFAAGRNRLAKLTFKE
ncbi:WD40/YVTN/BNR-like repeat-containing protein [Robertkochia sediminum]|uniref:WD40/YVTN/BNR-like repeat-containing protein n=1 Tax=Robertkochia sediminum TaxID=2785326 RepID=UPI001931E35F|nr:oxidoreductase [Robertkochia sediminum]MBL7473117.1 oxidoreductase [Robertkochia sediminum]